MSSGRWLRWKARAAALRTNTHAMYLAARDPRVPWFAKLVAGLAVAYALSPIDLVPDFIPILGHLDDLLIVPLGLALAMRLIPPAVLAEHRAAVARIGTDASSSGKVGAIIVIAVWSLALLWVVSIALRWFRT